MKLVQQARERWSSVLTLPAPDRLDDALLATGARSHRPVPFGPAPHGLAEVPGDEGMPLLGHALAYIRFGHRFTRARTEALGPVWWMRRDRPGRDPGGAHQPGQGVLPGGVARDGRRVLPPRPDAARLRRAPRAPADHAGGLHRRPDLQLRRRDHPRRARGAADLAGAAAALPGAQAAHPGRRAGGVHGRPLRTGGRGGEPGVRRLRPGRELLRPQGPARHPVAARAARA